MFEFGVSKDMKKLYIYIYIYKEGKVATHLCLALIVKYLKNSIQQGRVVTTLNILFSVV